VAKLETDGAARQGFGGLIVLNLKFLRAAAGPLTRLPGRIPTFAERTPITDQTAAKSSNISYAQEWITHLTFSLLLLWFIIM
jgi:hypothetical protein